MFETTKGVLCDVLCKPQRPMAKFRDRGTKDMGSSFCLAGLSRPRSNRARILSSGEQPHVLFSFSSTKSVAGSWSR